MMKKCSLLVAVSLFLACSDGDLQIEAIDFDSVDVQFCEDPEPTASNVLFKINGDEALILTLQSGALNNGDVAMETTETINLSTQTQLLYRIFSDNVNTAYFCDAIPPTEPIVTEEILAEDGQIIVNTVLDEGGTMFVHTIQLSDITLVNSQGERITDLTINDFGQVMTAVP